VRPSVYDFAGGAAAFQRLAAAHHERCLLDPVLNHPFSHPGRPDHLERLAAYWGEVFGGPSVYSADFGSQSSMLGMHASTGAGDDMPGRFVACFVAAADDADLPDDAELRRVLREYMQWAVSDVHAYSPEGSQVPAGARVPHWSWSGRC
jgi:hemoglobin